MKINEIMGKIKSAQKMIDSCWAIDKASLDNIRSIYSAFEKEPKAFLEMMDAEESPEILSFEDKTAFVSISGPMVNKHNCASIFYGMCSYEDIIGAVDRIKEMDNIDKVIFDIDSPGGMVDGCDNCAQAIKSLGVPTEARAGSTVASAAYWIASQCDEITATSLTASFGSIGVVIEYWDQKLRMEQMGLTEVVITSDNAPNKRLDALDEDDRRKIKASLTDIEEIFIMRVAEGRKVSRSEVLAKFGQGGMILAEKSRMAGMIDNVEIISNNIKKTNNTVSEEAMSLNDFLEKNPNARAEFQAQIDAKVEAGVKTSLQEDATKRSQIIDKAEKFLKADYPSQVTELAIKVIKGESSFEALETTATTIDAMREESKSSEAQAETESIGETLPQAVKEKLPQGSSVMITDEESLQEQAEKLRNY